MNNIDINDLSDAVIKGRLRSLGLSREDLNKPIIAIANTTNDIALPHRNFKQIADMVKIGIAQAGGVGLEFNVIAPCDGIAQGVNGMKYILPSREIIADSIETMVATHGIFDGLVCIGGCDKTLPGMLIAAARLDIPTIILGAGPIVPIGKNGALDDKLNRVPYEETDYEYEFKIEAFEKHRIHEEDFIKQAYLKKIITKEQFIEYYADALSTCGLCTSMATANTMGILCEAMGISLPDSFLIPIVANEKSVIAKEVGKTILHTIYSGLTARKILTRDAILNAISLDMAVGGSMNSVLHLLAVAHELDISITYEDFERISNKVPFITDILPNGQYNIMELYKSGGVSAVLNEIRSFLQLNTVNVQNKTLEEIINNKKSLNPLVIRSVNKPIRSENSIIILKGNIAKEGAVAKPIIMNQVEEFVGRAIVYECQQDFYLAAKRGEVSENAVIVVRNEGPVGGPGMTEGHRISEAIRSINAKNIALITDSRFSGATIGIVVGYITPEAAVGGEIGLVQNGDMIKISVKEHSINVLISEKELKQRKKHKRPHIISEMGYLKKYAEMVGSAKVGASTKRYTNI